MILIIGPFVGNFEQEILTFRPWSRWLFERVKELPEFEKVYVNTHFNRFFLYDFIDSDNLIPVYENLSRDELGQQDYIHNTIDTKDFNILIRTIKDRVCTQENVNKKDIQIEYLNYAKYMPHMPIYKKLFSRIDVDEESDLQNKIVFIPDNSCKKSQLLAIKTFLDDYEDVVIVGDRKCRFKDKNEVLNKYDYVENGYKTIIKAITDARCIITPLSVWTTVCNLQQKPVFSWGANPGQHKEGGVYWFRNKDCWSLADLSLDTTLGMIEHFLKEYK
jgi:hypothetical protein